jgi:signal transduction histidine kinase
MTTPSATGRVPFRMRLALVFVIVVGVSCGALAVSTFALSRRYRRHSFIVRSEREAEIHTELAPHPLTAAAAAQVVDVFNRAGGEDVVIQLDGGPVLGSSGFGMSDFPPSLRAASHAAATSVRVRGRPTLVIVRPADGGRWFFAFDESELDGGIRQLGWVLLVGWVLIVAVAALVGTMVARRTLRPVRDASDAARALAEGLLETRLPVGPDDEFGRWARYFNEMAAALEAKINALSEANERELRFTANVAHELRTPLAAAVNAAAVLDARLADAPESIRRPAELVIADVHRLRHLAQELLELARLDARQEAAAPEVVSINAVIEGARRAGRWEDTVTIDGPSVWVVAEGRRLERVMTNLLSNAVEHGGPPIHVSVTHAGTEAVVEVSDAGPGIPADQQQVIFDRFYKGDTSRAGGGAGLGLAIAAQHTRALGGTLTVRSGDGAGTTFVLRVPAAAATPQSRMLHAGA